MRLPPVALALACIASSAQATTLPTYGNIQTLNIAITATWEVRVFENLPVLFETIGSVDTDSLTWSLGSITSIGPTRDHFFTVESPEQRLFQNPSGFGEPIEYVIPGWSYSGHWNWGPDWTLRPRASSVEIDPVSLVGSLAFEPLELGHLSFTADHMGVQYAAEGPAMFATPWLRLECSRFPNAHCKSLLSLGIQSSNDPVVFEVGSPVSQPVPMIVRIHQIQGSVPEPSAGWLVGLALVGLAVLRRLRPRADARSSRRYPALPARTRGTPSLEARWRRSAEPRPSSA